MTSQERRIQSDKRIIASAIQSFGHLGYTYSSIRDIAKKAGITSGLITQRYGTKENLFLAAYTEAMKDAFSQVDDSASPRECLCSIIHDIEEMVDKTPDVFAFCTMLHNAPDYPKEILRPYQEQQKKTNTYMILKAAQKEKLLPQGNLDVLLAAFGAMVFHHTSVCRRYHQGYPSPEKYLEFIHFNDRISIAAKKWYRVLETAIANTFDFLVYINIPENRGEILNCYNSFSVQGDFEDARRDIELTIQNYYPEQERARLREYLNLDTLTERMKGRKSVSLKSGQMDGRIRVHTILPVTRDENGNLTEILAGVYQLNQAGLPELRLTDPGSWGRLQKYLQRGSTKDWSIY